MAGSHDPDPWIDYPQTIGWTTARLPAGYLRD